jgi:hypothetical protein
MTTHLSYSLDEVPPKFNFIFSNLIGPSLKQMRPWRLLNIECSVLKYRVLPLWPSYIGKRRATFAKEYGINLRCYWELFEEHIRNLRTLGGNM